MNRRPKSPRARHLRLLVWVGLLVVALPANAQRIGEIADFLGVRDNPLIGYGIVVGLDGTGDQTQQAPFTGQSMTNMLSQMGVTIPPGTNMQLRNVAAVVVTARLPPFARRGQQLDLVVSSIGNARSLKGGTLLMTPLKGVDGQVYAIAQGNVMVGGAGAEAGGSSVQINQLSGGRIPSGAIVERSVPLVLLADDNTIDLQLKTPNFGDAQHAAALINLEFRAGVAQPINGSTIRLSAPADPNALVGFLARVEGIPITLDDPDSKVIINSRTGSVVMNRRVSLKPAAIAHGNLTIVIDTAYGVSQPAPFGEGETVVIPDSDISVDRGTGVLQMVEGADLAEVVRVLNAMGATTQDLMSILEALRAAGSLQAELEII